MKVRAGRCECCGRTKPTWTPEKILVAIRRWAETHDGFGPASKEWRTAAVWHPAHSTVNEIFGGMTAANDAAGVKHPRRKNAADVWTRESIILAILRWNFEYGELPRWADWRNALPDYPSHYIVRRVFGSWNVAVVAAGYEPRCPRRTTDGYRKQAGALTRMRSAA